MAGVTIRDVAKEAGVSTATVSYVLNDSRPVAEETRMRVLKAANHLGYRANITARNLKASETRLIGYSWRPIPPDQFNPILDKFLQAIAEAAAHHGYRILAFPSLRTEEELATYEEMMLIGQVDGFVLSNTNFNDDRIRALMAAKFPFVAFGRANPSWNFSWVDIDGTAGIRAATQHLVEQGHERIAYLTWPESSQTGHYRLMGYLTGMREAGYTAAPEWIQLAENSHGSAYAATQRLLTLPRELRPSAIVAASDLMALGVINAGWDAGLEVGRDLAVVGFDDAPVARFLRPALTTLAQPVYEAGQRLMGILLDLVNGRPLAEHQILLSPTLVVRASSATPYHQDPKQ